MDNCVKQRTLRLDFIHALIHIAFVRDLAKYRNVTLVKKYPKLHKLDTSENLTALCTYSIEHYFGIFWLTFPYNITTPIIVHEVSHCVDRIFDTWGFKDSELRAYLNEWIFDEITQKDKNEK